jgi:protein-disulfide isomerase
MRGKRLVFAFSAAAVLAGGLIAGLALTGGGSSTPSGQALTSVSEVAAMLNGIPQNATALGRADAPVTLVEYADPQCPYCAKWATIALPDVVERYVRPGKVRIVFTGMDFVGPDSETALRGALAAARQNKLWNVLDLLFANQGTENTGWVTDSLLQSIGKVVPGLDWKAMLADMRSTSVDQAIAQAAARARQAGVNSTPSFAVGRTGGPMQLVNITSIDAAGIEPALDAALKQ